MCLSSVFKCTKYLNCIYFVNSMQCESVQIVRRNCSEDRKEEIQRQKTSTLPTRHLLCRFFSIGFTLTF